MTVARYVRRFSTGKTGPGRSKLTASYSQVEPEKKEIVSIFFSDVVGFTKIAESLSPEKVSDMLDRLYLRLDYLSEKHDVFKIETVGT